MQTPDIALIHLSTVRRNLECQIERENPAWSEHERQVEISRLHVQLAALKTAETYLSVARHHTDPLVAALAVRMIKDPTLIGLVMAGARAWPIEGMNTRALYEEAQDEVTQISEWLAEGEPNYLRPQFLHLEQYQAAVVALAHILNREQEAREAANFAEEEGVTVRHLNRP